MSHIVQVKPAIKPKLCVWTDLSVHNVDQINECRNSDEIKFLLQKLFDLDDSSRSGILLDLYINAINFAKSNNFNQGQMSALFSIVKQTHEAAVRTSFGNVQEAFEFFRKALVTHAVHRPPWSLEIFKPKEVSDVSNFVINSYFRHFKLYKYAFTAKVRLDLSINYLGRASSPEPEEVISETPTTPTTPLRAQSVLSEPPEDTNKKNDSEVSIETPTPSHEEALSELEALVRKAVGSQLKQMQVAVDKQLEKTEKNINEKIQHLEQRGEAATTPKDKKRSPKTSAKNKKK